MNACLHTYALDSILKLGTIASVDLKFAQTVKSTNIYHSGFVTSESMMVPGGGLANCDPC